MYYSTEKQMEKLDILAVQYGLEIRQMMELAGFHMLELFRQLKISKTAKVIVVVGNGNKGGDGLCATRHLINNGYKASVILVSTKISTDSFHQLKLLRKMKANVLLYSRRKKECQEMVLKSDILLDSLIGYHLEGAPRGVFKELIELLNSSKARIVAYDIPSGMDSTTGKCYDPCIEAFATLTLALPKKAFLANNGKKYSGRLFLGDIGIPDFLYDKISKDSRPNFNKKIVQL
ncbi:NAD(P)H-hydrate epimerase [Patescibacteria group bacterium]|nr:NAD(P)H-hydrate epimerase [Patescibacteria group bacterium]MBU1074536.1 NAD(P)H-hydrate epimerase [Patescibacteria group bacterium]MBU1951504.1 NAD(P)H-hydrate epimerase [Patescibacteria group bacterium]